VKCRGKTSVTWDKYIIKTVVVKKIILKQHPTEDFKRITLPKQNAVIFQPTQVQLTKLVINQYYLIA
jgi:hypothetical protein